MTKKAMTKEEMLCFLELMSEYPVITSKVTNATTNKQKEEAWVSLTAAFNSNYARFPKQKEQLKLKWDNLKRAARKRKHLIRLNRLKVQTGGKAEYISPDEVLEKVEYLMGNTHPSYQIPINDDDEVPTTESPEHPSYQIPINDDDEVPTTESPEIPIISLKVEDCADIQFQESNCDDLLVGQHEEGNRVISPVTQVEEDNKVAPKFLYRMPVPHQNKGKMKWPDDGRREKNLAIAKYFEKKTEKIDLEITLLKMEIENIKKNKY